MSKNKFAVGTRSSKLALWQTDFATREIKKVFPNADIEIKCIKTSGDISKDTPLYEFKKTGVFTKELDLALIRKEIDFAVHSLKDVETTLPDEICIGAFLKRGSVEDALVLKSSLRNKFSSLDNLPSGSKIGTSSVRRRAFIGHYYPHLECKDIRGNISTRLEKLESEDFSGTILAAAGLERLGLDHLISQKLPPEKFSPAVSQGVIGVVCLKDNEEVKKILLAVDDMETRLMSLAERAMLHKLEGGCKVPVGVFSCIRNDKLEISGTVVSDQEEKKLRKNLMGINNLEQEAENLGVDLAIDILENGGSEIITN